LSIKFDAATAVPIVLIFGYLGSQGLWITRQSMCQRENSLSI
jgi:hypothetical protein